MIVFILLHKLQKLQNKIITILFLPEKKPLIIMALLLVEWWLNYLTCLIFLLQLNLHLNGTAATVNREIEGGEEIDEVNLPVVVSCQKGMAEQRIPNMRGIMGARTKPLKVMEPVASRYFDFN